MPEIFHGGIILKQPAVAAYPQIAIAVFVQTVNKIAPYGE
jgi:hypothetical protein